MCLLVLCAADLPHTNSTLFLHAQEHDTRQKLKAAEKLANSRTIAAREAEHTLRTTAREKREAECGWPLVRTSSRR